MGVLKLKLPKGWNDTIVGIQLDDDAAYGVGQNGVTSIQPELMNLGAYGIAWFRVYVGEHMVARVNAALVKAIIYEERVN